MKMPRIVVEKAGSGDYISVINAELKYAARVCILIID